jgi:hypothetical protein
MTSKKMVITIPSIYKPFPDGTCKSCGHNHGVVTIKEKHRRNYDDDTLASLFWKEA